MEVLSCSSEMSRVSVILGLVIRSVCEVDWLIPDWICGTLTAKRLTHPLIVQLSPVPHSSLALNRPLMTRSMYVELKWSSNISPIHFVFWAYFFPIGLAGRFCQSPYADKYIHRSFLTSTIQYLTINYSIVKCQWYLKNCSKLVDSSFGLGWYV